MCIPGMFELNKTKNEPKIIPGAPKMTAQMPKRGVWETKDRSGEGGGRAKMDQQLKKNSNIANNLDVISMANNLDTLDLDYYVLTYNLEKARSHFKQVKPMLKCFEYLFSNNK